MRFQSISACCIVAASAFACGEGSMNTAGVVQSTTLSSLANTPPFVPGQLIIGFRSGFSAQDVSAFYRSSPGGAILREVENLDRAPAVMQLQATGHVRHQRLVTVPTGRTLELAEQIAKHPAVEYAEPNYLLYANLAPNDPSYADLWGLNNTGQTGGTADADIDAPEAWNVGTGSSDILVAVIDTGVNYLHPDLSANIWTNPDEIPGNGVDDDGNGYVDDIHGINAISNSGDPDDDHFHGSHVAGTIGATGNNDLGVVGVNWAVKIIGCKFLNAAGNGTVADAVKCFKYLNHLKAQQGHDIRVSNNSWSGGGFTQSLVDAMEGLDQPGMAPILHACAAGNANNDNDVFAWYPSSYNLDNIIAVAATDHNDDYADFTSYGSTTVDLAAPGVNVLSTSLGTGYTTASGTSMATPHVAGAAGLAWSTKPSLGALEMKSLLMATVDPISPTKPTVTNGRLNALGAVQGGNNQPVVTISAPVDGDIFDEGTAITFTGSASDIEDGDLSANLSWVSDLDGAIGSGGTFTTTLTSVGTHHITAAVTDSGNSTGSSRVSISINVPGNTTPTVTISAPADGGTFDRGISITFTGRATDIEDGDLTAGLSWESNLDGVIGSGGSFTYAPPTLGTHRITASATDSGASTGSSQVSITLVVGQTINPPSDLTATLVIFGGVGVMLSWVDNSDDETHFRLERRVGAAGRWTFHANLVNPSFIDSSVVRQKTYYYRVQACNSTTCSDFSNTVVAGIP